MTPSLFLVRHGLPLVVAGRPPHEWQLDPAGFGDIAALRRSGRLPDDAVWFSSPEPKAVDTAGRLTSRPVTVVGDLREHVRGVTPWMTDRAEWQATVRRVFDVPDEPAMPGWEPLSATRDRLLPAVQRILADHPDQHVALVGHGTAWTLLMSELTGSPPDHDAWARLAMPDVWSLPRDVIRCGRDRRRFG